MNFIKPAVESINVDGIEYKNPLMNLDTVITIKKMQSTATPPKYFAIQFICIDGNDYLWQYVNHHEMRSVYDKIMNYIAKNANNEM